MPRDSADGSSKPTSRRRRAAPGDWGELVELGFTQMEAEVYAYLLAHPPATGYAVAKALGKPAPYVYRAMESLLRQGAVLTDGGSTSHCRAIPFDELLDRLKRRFQERCERATQRMKQVVPPEGDDGVYRLATVDQVFERSRTMLADATQVAYLDLFPGPLAVLRKEIAAAVRRKVRVGLLAYEPTDLPVAWSAIFPPEGLVQGWPRQWLRLAIDGTEYLSALLTQDGRGIYQAVWSASPVLAYMQTRSMGAEILLASVQSAVRSGAALDSIHADLRQWQKLFQGRLLPGAERVARLFSQSLEA